MPEAPTQGMSQLHAALSALQQATTRLERELVGFEHLAGALLAYAQQQPGFDPVALNDLAQHWMRSGEWSLDDPALAPFERLEAVLRSRQDSPVRTDSLPIEQRRGFPYPPLLRPVK